MVLFVFESDLPFLSNRQILRGTFLQKKSFFPNFFKFQTKKTISSFNLKT